MNKVIYKVIICFMCIVNLVGCTQVTSQETMSLLEDVVRIHFIDTGNSDAILIQQGSTAALIDGGDNDDEKQLPQYIKNQGISKLEYIFATHPDADHIGGLDGVLNTLEVGQVFVSNGDADTKTYSDFITAIMSEGLTPSVPLIDSTYPLGEGTFEVLSVANMKDPNNNSIVLLYTYGNNRILLMGDAGREIEATINVGKVDLLKVGHHGSSTSTDPEFIAQVAPEYAVITCGENNKYGHPHTETLETLAAHNITVYRTDEMGTIVFELTGSTLNLEGEVLQETSANIGQDNAPIIEESDTPVAADNSQDENNFQIEGVVYYTASGKKYHLDQSCSNMKNPISTTIDQVGERTPCQKCVN